MSAPPTDDVRHPSAQVHGAKVVKYFGFTKKIYIILKKTARTFHTEIKYK